MSTAHYCRKCKINWASVFVQDDAARDESYEFCPVCNSDMDLQDSIPGDQYVMHLLTGAIVNVDTLEPLVRFSPAPFKEPKHFDLDAWKDMKQEKLDRIESAIDVYTNTFDTQGREAAEKAYFNQLQIINQNK